MLVLLLLPALAFSVYAGSPLLLEALLVYETPLRKAEAVILDGTGGIVEQTIELVRQGYAEKIIVFHPIPKRLQSAEQPVSTAFLILEDLRKAGIAQEQIIAVTPSAYDKVDLQLALRKAILEHEIDSYIVLPMRNHSRLVKMIHEDTFSEQEVTVCVYPMTARRALRREIVNIHNTIIRMLYWQLVHRHNLRERIALE